MNDWLAVPDVEQFVNKCRMVVFRNFGKWDEESEIDTLIENAKPEEIEELDKILSYKESLLIVKELLKKQVNKKTQKIRFILNDDIFIKIIENLNGRMVSNILQNLVNMGLVESSYDSDNDDFLFWVKEN